MKISCVSTLLLPDTLADNDLQFCLEVSMLHAFGRLFCFMCSCQHDVFFVYESEFIVLKLTVFMSSVERT